MKKRSKKSQGRLTKLFSVSIFLFLLVTTGTAKSTQASSNDKLSTTTHLSDAERQLIATIISANKVNREKLTSFDCSYKRTNKTASERIYSGRYAFNPGRIYSREVIEDTSGEGLLYVKVDNKAWNINLPSSNSNIIVYSAKGHKDLRPPCPDPWNQMDNDIGFHFEQNNNEFSRIASVKQININNRSLLAVEINQRMATDPPEQFLYKKIYHFSLKDGYLPVRIEFYSTNDSGELIPSYFKDVTKINSYEVEGKTVYLPVEYHATYYRGGTKYREGSYKILEETVRINPELPEELFKITINPGDRVNDKDRELIYRIPADGLIGVNAHDFSLVKLGSNEKVTLSKIKADVIVLDFWATWCGPCKKLHPALEALHKWANENKKSIAFYCINVKEESDVVAEYWKESDHKIPVLFDSDGSVFKTYKGSGIPYIIIISNGIIKNVHTGSGAEVDVLEQHIKDMIDFALED